MSNELTLPTQSESLTNYITALCLLGQVAVRPSKTGLRIALVSPDQEFAFITRALINEDNSDYTITTQLQHTSGNASEKHSHETLADAYVSIFNAAFTEGGCELPSAHGFMLTKINGTDPLTPMMINELCQDHIVAVRPSKSGVRVFAINKSGEGAAKIRIVDNKYSVGRINQDGEFVGDTPITLDFEQAIYDGESSNDNIATLVSHLTKHEVVYH